MANHPGIEYFNKLAAAIDDPQALRSRLGAERSGLVRRLEEQDPKRRDPEMMQRLKTLEVAFAASQWTDLNHPNARHSIESAAKGLSNTGNALRSRLFELETANAEKGTPRPQDRFTVRVEHNGM
ncbi:MAG: hypothetical protein KKA05_01765 [Alphaproteobacteria bacterium]|nr:hypothetical protein [Alphaproteobacteria bacterium]